MKKVFLIGDSMRYGLFASEHRVLGYGIHVARTLEEQQIAVYQPDENARFSQYTLRYLHEWKNKAGCGDDIDLVYWNNGLWDALRMFDDDPLTPIPFYRDNLARVLKRIHLLFPKAKVIFALSTPVTEGVAPDGWIRRNSEIQEYNQAARETLQPLGVVIDDLYTVAAGIRGQHAHDWVHYTEEGAKILAAHVCEVITENL